MDISKIKLELPSIIKIMNENDISMIQNEEILHIAVSPHEQNWKTKENLLDKLNSRLEDEQHKLDFEYYQKKVWEGEARNIIYYTTVMELTDKI